jgi:2-iminobutanoate/2-iminopropanoate deaminase
MKKEIIRSPKIGGSYSKTTVHGTKAGGFVFVTGQIGNKPGTAPAGTPHEIVELGSIEEQTVQVMENVKAILEQAGTTLDNVVKRNVYITNNAEYPKIYEVLERYFPSPVASTGVITGLVPPSARVEIDVIAVVPEK